MKITESKLRNVIKSVISEAGDMRKVSSDGSWAPEEEDQRAAFLQEISSDIDALLLKIASSSQEIGGPFRGPGIKAEAKALLMSKLRSFR